MKKQAKIIAFIVAIIIVLAAIFVLTSREEGEVFTITSTDGAGMLEIPENALPDGTTLDDIKITKISANEFFGEGADEDGALAYQLEPDGLKFKKPVFVSMTLKNEGSGAIPLLFHKSGDEVDTVSNTKVEINQETRETKLTGQIDHFSTVAGSKHFFLFEDSVVSGGTGKVEESFPYELKIFPTPAWIKVYTHQRFRVAPGTTWKMDGVSVSLNESELPYKGYPWPSAPWNGKVEPRTLRAPKTDIPGGGTFELTGTHTCKKEGSVYFETGEVGIEYRQEKEMMRYNYDTQKRDIKETYYSTAKTLVMFRGPGIQCLCPEEPVFTYAEDPEAPPIEVSTAFNIVQKFSTGEIEKFGHMINIPVLLYYDGVTSHYMPFPKEQFTVEPMEEYEETPRFEGWCRNEYYTAPKALSIDIELVSEPQQTCLWGTRTFEGVLEVCQKTLEEWDKMYRRKPWGGYPFFNKD